MQRVWELMCGCEFEKFKIEGKLKSLKFKPSDFKIHLVLSHSMTYVMIADPLSDSPSGNLPQQVLQDLQ